MTLREKYDHAIQTAKGVRMQGGAEERDGKLHFNGTVQTQDEANKIWDAIKTIPAWQQDVVADIRATGPAAGAQGERTYTVKSGDTLSKISIKAGPDRARRKGSQGDRATVRLGSGDGR